MTNDAAVVLLSGGQDSTTCLYWAKERFKAVYALSFHYGQRHAAELEAARTIAGLAGVPHCVIQDFSISSLVTSALLSPDEKALQTQREGTDLPASFVPGRNIIFMALAGAYAYELRAAHLVLGVCETDYSGYPDCREHTIRRMEEALRCGIWGEEPNQSRRGHDFWTHTPLMYKTKAESVQMARALPGCWEALAHSVTCYMGRRPGCGACPACVLRQRGFQEAGEHDPASEIH